MRSDNPSHRSLLAPLGASRAWLISAKPSGRAGSATLSAVVWQPAAVVAERSRRIDASTWIGGGGFRDLFDDPPSGGRRRSG